MKNLPTNNTCSVCGEASCYLSVTRKDLITMQNYIYPEYTDAINAETGDFMLYNCRNCGYAYNAVFDLNLLSYDKNYDNTVPSSVFLNYYKQIASFLYNNFDLDDSLVIDVGCGKGAFLQVLCSMYNNVRGLGMDPSYEPDNFSSSMPNLEFIQDIFKQEYITEKPSLILCRHVLEHIEKPVPFLQSIHSAASSYAGTPVFIEVPDLDWIIDNGAFWDFCYEHCNYFTADSLHNTLQITGFEPEFVRKAFNGQYLWALGKIGQDITGSFQMNSISDRLDSYSSNEMELMSNIENKLNELKRGGSRVAVWGMATKGVILCNLVDSEKELFDFCIDVNKKKTECFVPHTGHQISAPEILTQVGDSELTVVVMNPNYLAEINKTCQSLSLNPLFIDANGNQLELN